MWRKPITYTGEVYRHIKSHPHTQTHDLTPSIHVISTRNKFKRSSHMYGTITVIEGKKLVETGEMCMLFK